MKHILMTGASGLIGRALCDALIGRGDKVTGVSRTPRAGREGLSFVQGDPAQAATYVRALEGVDAIVNLAGAPIAKRWTTAYRKEVMASRVGTTQALVKALHDAPHAVRTFLSASAVGYYGYDRESPSQSEEAPRGTGFLAEVADAWEKAAAHTLPEGVRLVLPRFGVVLAKEGGALVPMAWATRLGIGGAVGDGNQPFSWIHRKDAVRMLLFLLDTPDARGPFNCVTPTAISQGDLFASLGKTLRRPVWVRPPPWAVRVLLGQLGEEALIGGQRAIPKKARQLGFTWLHPDLGPALHDLLA